MFGSDPDGHPNTMFRRRTLSFAAIGTALAAAGTALFLCTAAGFPVRQPAAAPLTKPTTPLAIEHISPSAGTYGTGIVIRVRFDRDVPKAARDEVTQHIVVTTSNPIGEAGWAWSDRRTAVFRPREFWPAHTTVSITTLTSPEVISTSQDTDLLWAGVAERSFSIGRSQVIRVSSDKHQASVVRDGVKIRTMPIARGKPGWESRSGIKTLMESYRVKEMTGESINAEEEYTLQVPYAIRMTNSGEFIHAAPWAAGNLGRVNGSHGCTNLSMADGAWLFTHHLYGDPVITTGTGRPMETDNGAGAVWNVSWAKWTTGVAS